MDQFQCSSNQVESTCTSVHISNLMQYFLLSAMSIKLLGEFYLCALHLHSYKTQDQFRASMQEVHAKLDQILAIIQPPK